MMFRVWLRGRIVPTWRAEKKGTFKRDFVFTLSLLVVSRFSPKMNIFRLAGDVSHLLAILLLLWKIWKTRSCAGKLLYSYILLNYIVECVLFLLVYKTLRSIYDCLISRIAKRQPQLWFHFIDLSNLYYIMLYFLV